MTPRGLLAPAIGLGLVAAWLSADLLVGDSDRLIGEPIIVEISTSTPGVVPSVGATAPSVEPRQSGSGSTPAAPLAPPPAQPPLADDDGTSDDDGAVDDEGTSDDGASDDDGSSDDGTSEDDGASDDDGDDGTGDDD